MKYSFFSHRNSHEEEIANLIQQTFHETISRKCRSICLPNLYQKKQSQDTVIRFIKTLVKFISENHTDEITYVRLVAHGPNQIQHYRKTLSNWTTQQKNQSLIFDKSKVKYIKEKLNITFRYNSVR